MRSQIVLFLFVVIFNVASGGIYLDNGFGQTTLNRNLTKYEKLQLEIEILNILGLPNKPKKVHYSVQKSTLKYLMSVYNTLVHNNLNKKRNKRSVEASMDKSLQTAIEESDMIMTFDSVRQYKIQSKYEKGTRLRFNVSDMPVAEKLLRATLRIFQKGIKGLIKTKHVVFTVEIFQIIDSISKKSEIMRYISSINTTLSHSGWLDFNVTSSLLSWVVFPNTNKGFYLSVYPATKPGHEIPPSIIGLVTTAKRKNEETLPFMVVFFQNFNEEFVTRKTRSINNKRGGKSEKIKYSGVMDYYRHETWTTGCKIKTLYISFKDLRWQDWILAPEAYSAYYCSGECKFPLTSHMNATAHALVQSWVHFKYPHKIPKPSCAPTEMMPLYLIYQHSDNAALRKRKDMIVKSCGCH